MDKKSHERGEREGAAEAEEILATGDAVILSRAITDLADSFRAVARALRDLTPDGTGDDEDSTHGRYLDGKRIDR